MISNQTIQPGLSAVQVDATSWSEFAADTQRIVWITDDDDVVSLNYFERPPDLVAPPHDIEAIREQYRTMVGDTGGIVELETDFVDELPAVRSVLKLAQQPAGRTYIGALTVPRAGFSHVLKVECVEREPIGTREMAVFMRLASQGRVQFATLDLPSEGWAVDPYDPGHDALVLRTRADDDLWDALYPDHPLSRCRRILQRLRDTTRLADVVRFAPPFECDDDDE